MFSVVVLISGSGSNLLALLEAADNPLYPARVLAVGSDNPASGLEHAEAFGVPTFVVEPDRFQTREEFANVLLGNIDFFEPDLVVLAGFMKMLPPKFVESLKPKLINLHPSLLPLFPGINAVRDALAAGAKLTGTTIHLVDAGMDTGPVISQRELAIPEGITEAQLTEMIKVLEREHLVDVVRDISEGTLDVKDLI